MDVTADRRWRTRQSILIDEQKLKDEIRGPRKMDIYLSRSYHLSKFSNYSFNFVSLRREFMNNSRVVFAIKVLHRVTGCDRISNQLELSSSP